MIGRKIKVNPTWRIGVMVLVGTYPFSRIISISWRPYLISLNHLLVRWRPYLTPPHALPLALTRVPLPFWRTLPFATCPFGCWDD